MCLEPNGHADQIYGVVKFLHNIYIKVNEIFILLMPELIETVREVGLVTLNRLPIHIHSNGLTNTHLQLNFFGLRLPSGKSFYWHIIKFCHLLVCH